MVTAYAAIPVGPLQVGGIPEIAFTIPDLEGTAKMQIFANSSQTEIGCFQAVMTNGASFSQPQAVAPVLAVFAVTAAVASFLTAAYGVSLAHMRAHYAHSLSVLIVFETFQSIFLTGVLSVEWPSVLIAWWSNFAWAAGMIPTASMVRSINTFTGVGGNGSQVGGAGSAPIDSAGGLAATIYGRDLMPSYLRRRALEEINLTTTTTTDVVRHALTRRTSFNASDPYDYTWGGDPVGPGMPLPGTLFGFPATLAPLGIPAKDAFTIALVWLMALLLLVAACMAALKCLMEALARLKLVRPDRLAYFRAHWLRYTAQAVLRTLFIAFFMVAVLSLYQFTVHGGAGTTAVAAVVFAAFLLGLGGLATYACHTRFRHGRFRLEPDQLTLQRTRILGVVPFVLPARASTLRERNLESRPAFAVALPRLRYAEEDGPAVHNDPAHIRRFGWLSARYRRARWWFFLAYLCYSLVRACFVGGAANAPLAQVYGLFVFDLLALAAVARLRPFEGARNTAMGVWIVGVCRVVTTGLSIAFLPAFALDRIAAAVLGVIIIIMQGAVVVALMILVILGVVSTRWSLSRNREELYNVAHNLAALRVTYFERLEAWAVADVAAAPKPRGPETKPEPEGPTRPYFSVRNVRRAPKIEDEGGGGDAHAHDEGEEVGAARDPVEHTIDAVVLGDEQPPAIPPPPRLLRNRTSRTNSASSRYSVSRPGRASRRTSWSATDIAKWDLERTNIDRSEQAAAAPSP